MTALPDRAYLRRYALPAHFLAELGLLTAGNGAPPASRDSAPREKPPVLAWRLNTRGQPASAWTTDHKPSG